MLRLTYGSPATLASGVLLSLGMCAQSRAAEVVRTPLPDGNAFPIAAAVTVPAGFDTVYVSGALPSMVNKEAAKGSVDAYGDMTTQAESALSNIKASLLRLGLGMGDIVKMTVFMVGDATKGNKLDFAGLMAAYSKFFGTAEQPNKPARSAVQVAALVAPGALVEIEVIAVKRHDADQPHHGKD